MWCKISFLILFSIIGASLVWCFIEKLIKPHIKSKLPNDPDRPKDHLAELPLLAFLSGFLEILLFSSSFLIDKPEFILLWLGIKTALKWDRKRNEQKEYRDFESRGQYFSFLIGNAVNIILAFTIASIISGQFLYFK